MCNITNIYVRKTQSLKCDKGSTVKHSQYNTGSTCTTQSKLCNTGSTTRSKSKTQAIQYNTSNTVQHGQHRRQYRHIAIQAVQHGQTSTTWSKQYNTVRRVQHGQNSTTRSAQKSLSTLCNRYSKTGGTTRSKSTTREIQNNMVNTVVSMIACNERTVTLTSSSVLLSSGAMMQ